MPAKSKSQQRLAGAALHGATFAKAKELRASMTAAELRAFASGPEQGKPAHVKKPKAR